MTWDQLFKTCVHVDFDYKFPQGLPPISIFFAGLERVIPYSVPMEPFYKPRDDMVLSKWALNFLPPL